MDLVVLYGKSENGFCVYIEKRKNGFGLKNLLIENGFGHKMDLHFLIDL